MDDAAKLLAVRIKDVDPARTAAIDVACAIHFHAIGSTRLGTTHVS
jgi:hypothetical protein